mgnify:CR=1 FL=1
MKSDQEIYNALSEILRKMLSLDNIEVTESTTADDFDEWDSYQHIAFILAVEEHFGIKLDISEIEAYLQVSNLVQAIKDSTN